MKFLFILILCWLFSLNNGDLYGTTRIFRYNNDLYRVAIHLGQIDLSSGNFTHIATTQVFEFNGVINSQASTFDQYNRIFYYFGDGPFIYGVNITTKQLLPPVYFAALDFVQSLAWTMFNSQLYLLGSRNGINYIYSYPANSASVQLVNLTAHGIPAYTTVAFAADPSSGNGYVVYTADSNKGIINILSFTPSGKVTITPLGCTIPFFSVSNIFYDPVVSKLVGVGQTSKMVYFEQSQQTGLCRNTTFNGGNTMEEVAYDPRLSTIYVYGSYDGVHSHLYSWVTTSSSSTSIPVGADWNNLIVAYGW